MEGTSRVSVTSLTDGQWCFLLGSVQGDSHPSGNHQHHSIEMQHPFFNLQSNARVMHHYCKSNAPLCVFHPPTSRQLRTHWLNVFWRK